jgi:mediator of RNA polymerase II transcription subunit 8, fungi type
LTVLTFRENLLTALSLLLSHLNSLTTTLQSPRFSQDLKSTAVYPQTLFPVRLHETILTSLLKRKLLPDDEEWERQGREIAEKLHHVDPEREDEFVEWCQTRFIEITEGRDYSRGTKTKEEKEATERNGDQEESDENEEDGGGKRNGIELGASLKYLAQGWEPTKPPPSNPSRPIR